MSFVRVVFSLALPAAVAAVPVAAQEVITEKAPGRTRDMRTPASKNSPTS
jgi:hypothetical protein